MTSKILRFPKTIEKTGISRSSIYLLLSRNKFPKPIQLSPRAVGFLESELDQWLADKAAERA